MLECLLFSFGIVGLAGKHLFFFSPSCSNFLNTHALTCLLHRLVKHSQADVSGFKAMGWERQEEWSSCLLYTQPYPLSRFDTLLRVTLTIETKMATQYGKHYILKILQESRGLNWVFSETNKKFYFIWLYTDKLKIILTIFFVDLY